METTSSEHVNAEQLFDLALQASKANDTQKSIGLIKAAIEQSPQDARMRYMLGSLYANIGIYDKAVRNMEKSLELDQNYGIARFHLGLLYLMSGRQADAESTWAPLESNGEDHYLTLFKTGLLKIANDDIDHGIQLIKAGIDKNQLNDSLNKDMETVIAHASMSKAVDWLAGFHEFPQ